MDHLVKCSRTVTWKVRREMEIDTAMVWDATEGEEGKRTGFSTPPSIFCLYQDLYSLNPSGSQMMQKPGKYNLDQLPLVIHHRNEQGECLGIP